MVSASALASASAWALASAWTSASALASASSLGLGLRLGLSLSLGLGLSLVYQILYSRMLCEGSPLFFYTASGPVAPTGLYQGDCGLRRQTAGQTAQPRL